MFKLSLNSVHFSISEKFEYSFPRYWKKKKGYMEITGLLNYRINEMEHVQEMHVYVQHTVVVKFQVLEPIMHLSQTIESLFDIFPAWRRGFNFMTIYLSSAICWGRIILNVVESVDRSSFASPTRRIRTAEVLSLGWYLDREWDLLTNSSDSSMSEISREK